MKVASFDIGHVLRPSRRLVPAPAAVREAPAAAGPGIRKDLLTVIVLFAVLRGMLFGFNYVGRAMTRVTDPSLSFSRLGPYWDGWIRFDSGWFMGVIKHGYLHPKSAPWTAQTTVAFFPLYPYSVKMAMKVVGSRNHWYAGLVLANASTLFGLYFVLRIARRYLGEEGARRSVAYLLLFPSSFFFSSYYSEGLFLLTTAASFCFFLERRYFWCGVWGYLAALTRSPGVLLFPAFALGLAWERRGKVGRDDLGALWLLLIPGGLLTFMAVLQVKVGNALAFVHVQAAWLRKSTFPLETLRDGFRGIDWALPFDALNMVRIMDCTSAVVFLILPFFLLRKFDKSLAIYSFLVILMPLSSGAVYSMMRFELAAFPAFFVLARLGANRDFDRAIVSVSAIFLGLLNLGFTNWYFIG